MSTQQFYTPPAQQKPAAPGDLRPKIAWPTMLFVRAWNDADKHRQSLIDEAYRIEKEAEQNIDSGIAVAAKSEDGLFESHFDLLKTTEHEGLVALADFLKASVANVVSYVNKRKVAPERIDVDLKDSWYHITNKGGFHDAHYHGGCSWCGIYYIEAGDVPTEQPKYAPNGVNRFYSPIRVGAVQDDYGNEYLSENQIDVPPKTGTCVIFPAYLLHSGLPYRGETDRVIIAFNSTSKLRTSSGSD